MSFCCLSHMCEECSHKDEREALTCPHQGTKECEVEKWKQKHEDGTDEQDAIVKQNITGEPGKPGPLVL